MCVSPAFAAKMNLRAAWVIEVSSAFHLTFDHQNHVFWDLGVKLSLMAEHTESSLGVWHLVVESAKQRRRLTRPRLLPKWLSGVLEREQDSNCHKMSVFSNKNVTCWQLTHTILYYYFFYNYFLLLLSLLLEELFGLLPYWFACWG